MRDLGAQRFAIGRRVIGDGQPVFIVAEAGVNHLGRRDLALDLVRAAAAAVADAIKFQTCRVSEFLPEASVDYAEYRRTALSLEEYRAVAQAARQAGIVFFSTPLDEGSADLLARVRVPAYKVASCDLTHRPLLSHLAAKRKPVILSTGMAELGEVRQAVRALREAGAPAVAVLHCVFQYPAEPRHVHLRAMDILRRTLGLPVGLSDHTIGLAVPCAAVALGACIIEKHFTLDHALPGDDHRFSADPNELRELVAAIRQVEQAMGRAKKAPAAVEFPARRTARRIIVAAKAMPEGAAVRRADVAFQRPDLARHRVERCLSPWAWPRIEGRRLVAGAAPGDALTRAHVGW